MRKYILKIMIGLVLLGSTVMATEEWIIGVPEQADTTNYEWILGQPYILTEEVSTVVIMRRRREN